MGLPVGLKQIQKFDAFKTVQHEGYGLDIGVLLIIYEILGFISSIDIKRFGVQILGPCE